MLTPEKYLEQEWQSVDKETMKLLIHYHKHLLKSIIDDLEANRNKNAVEYLKSKL